MAAFFVVRHGEVAAKSPHLPNVLGSIDSPLTQNGVEQSRSVGRRLAQYAIGALCYPPLARTAETARQIQAEAGGKLYADTELAGRDMGIYALGGHKSMAAHAEDIYTTPVGTPYYIDVPGAEHLADCYERLQLAYDKIRARFANKPGAVVLVTQHLAGTLLRGAHDELKLHDALEYEDLGHEDIAHLPANALSHLL